MLSSYSNDSPSGLTVLLGLQSLVSNFFNRDIRFVTAIEKHPDFDVNTHENDIALVKLHAPLTFNDYIRPICLAANGSVFPTGTESRVTGWVGGRSHYCGCLCVLVSASRTGLRILNGLGIFGIDQHQSIPII